MATLCNDLEVDVARLERKLAEARAVDLTEAKASALRAAKHAAMPQPSSPLAHASSAGGGAAAGTTPAPTPAVAWENAERSLAAQTAGKELRLTGAEAEELLPKAMRPAARRAEAEARREEQLGELRKLMSFRKLKEAARESAHQRHIAALANGAINAIAAAVDGGAAAHRGASGDGGSGGSTRAGLVAAFSLRSVAEVQEAEQALREELHEMQAQDARALDKLAALQKVIVGSEAQHDHHMRGKVRYLLKKHTRLDE